MNIAVLGAGAMGGALASGLISYGDGKYNLAIANPTAEKLERFADSGAFTTTDNVQAISGSEVVVIAVKPWILPDVIDEIKDAMDYEAQSVIVIAAGVSSDRLRELFDREGELPEIIVAMPNTAMSVRRSMTFLVAVNSESAFVESASAIFNCLGSTMVIDEKHLPAATALASCGIAYAMRYVRAAVEGGVELGFRASEAQTMILQTLTGAVALLGQPGAHPESEIDKVTTPGGLTIKGLNEMERHGFTNAVISGLKASAR